MTVNNFGYIKTGRGVNLFFGAKPVPVDQSHLYYNEILEELKTGNPDVKKILELSDVPEAIKGKLFGDVTVTDGEIYFKNKPVHNTLTSKMIQLMKEGWDISIWANFLNNVMKNPSEVAINELYLFLEQAEMPLTPDGHFLAFKKVRNDYTSIHDGKTDNSIGSKPSMPREEVDPDRDRHCSRGLHFCAHSYLSNFGSTSDARVVIVKINPADVVAIPSDYSNAKGRAWTYEIVGEIDNPGHGPRDKRFDKAVDDSWDAPEIEVVEPELDPVIDELQFARDIGALTDEQLEKAKATRVKVPTTVQKIERPATEELLFGDIYTAKEILAKVKQIGSVRGAGRALGIAKSTFGDWYKKAKEEAARWTDEDGEIFDYLKDILVTNIGDIDTTKIVPDADIINDLGLDSFDVIELVMLIEEKYDIEITEEEMLEIATLQDVIDLVKKELA